MAKSTAFARIKRDILTLTCAIPPGRVCTYSAIADHLDVMARQVAYILATLSEADRAVVPWHRVVAQAGRISLPNRAKAAQQIEALLAEGITVTADQWITDFDTRLIEPAALHSGVPRQQRPH